MDDKTQGVLSCFFKHYNPWHVHTGGTIKTRKKHTPAVCINDSEAISLILYRVKHDFSRKSNVCRLFWLELCLKRVEILAEKTVEMLEKAL